METLEINQLTGADEMWFSLEAENTPMHINDIHIYDPSTAPNGNITRKEILSHIEKRLDKLYLREKRVPVPFSIDYSYWETDQNFDLEYHVRSTKIAKPGNWKQFTEKVSQIISKPLDMTRPLWEMHIIEGLDSLPDTPKGCFAIIHKKHHGQFDGSAANYMKSIMHTLDLKKDDFKDAAASPALSAKSEPSDLELLQRTIQNSLVRPIEQFIFFYKSMTNLPSAIQMILRDSLVQKQTCRTRFSGTIPSAERVIEARVFPLEEIQTMRKIVPGSTVNDVVVTIFSGALGKYLAHHNELPDQPLNGLVPISIRHEEETGKRGNKVFSMITKTHCEISEPVESMKKTHEATVYSKEYTKGINGRNMAEMLEISPLPIIHNSIKLAMGMKLNDYVTAMHSGVAISNVPGHQVPLYFCGAKQIRCYNWGFLMDGMGLLLVAGSYNGEVVFTAESCPEMMPDIDFFADCLQKAYDELKAKIKA